MIKNLILLFTNLFLVGCIGSAVLVDAEEEQSPFPFLSDVPDEVETVNLDLYNQQEQVLSDSYQDELNYNQKLRQEILDQ